tara:strand:- start:575 stop:1057 length:483 start_codon:yes stop_codon:yes gene_type:complete
MINCRLHIQLSSFEERDDAGQSKINTFFQQSNSRNFEQDTVAFEEIRSDAPPESAAPRLEAAAHKSYCTFSPLSTTDDKEADLVKEETGMSFFTKDLRPCQVCGQEVQAEDWREHTDFHYAENLQRSFQGPSKDVKKQKQGDKLKEKGSTIHNFFSKVNK